MLLVSVFWLRADQRGSGTLLQCGHEVPSMPQQQNELICESEK